jgi:hypothetical protein
MKFLLELCDPPPIQKDQRRGLRATRRFSFWFDLIRRKNRTIKRGHRGFVSCGNVSKTYTPALLHLPPCKLPIVLCAEVSKEYQQSHFGHPVCMGSFDPREHGVVRNSLVTLCAWGLLTPVCTGYHKTF